MAPRFLLVDDDPDTVDSMQTLFTLMGADVHVLYSAADIVGEVERFDPDAVVLDVMMPGVTGHDAVRLIRQCARFQRLPVVALSGLGRECDRVASIAAGFDSHQIKPIDPKRLRTLLIELARSYRAGSVSSGDG